MTVPEPNDIRVVDLNELLPAKFKRHGLKLKHFEGYRTAEGVELTLRETRHMEPSYLPKAMAIFAALYARTSSQGRLLLMHILWEAGQGRASQLVDMDGETLMHMPDRRGDPAYDLYVKLSVEEEEPAPPKTKRKAKQASTPTAKRDKKG